MGLMSKVFGNTNKQKAVSNTNGDHNIAKNSVFKPYGAATPTNPDSFDTVDSAPILKKPRYFTPQEAAALKGLQAKRQGDLKATQQAYRSLKHLHTMDTTIHQNHQNYVRKTAKNELKRQQANSRTAETLHALRPEYAMMGGSLDRAESSASTSIAAIKSSLANG